MTPTTTAAGILGPVHDDLAQRITVAVYRDDDTDVVVFVDDHPVTVRVHLVDPGRGHTREDWEEMRRSEVAASRERGRENVAAALDGMYTLGHDTPWIVEPR